MSELYGCSVSFTGTRRIWVSKYFLHSSHWKTQAVQKGKENITSGCCANTVHSTTSFKLTVHVKSRRCKKILRKKAESGGVEFGLSFKSQRLSGHYRLKQFTMFQLSLPGHYLFPAQRTPLRCPQASCEGPLVFHWFLCPPRAERQKELRTPELSS